MFLTEQFSRNRKCLSRFCLLHLFPFLSKNLKMSACRCTGERLFGNSSTDQRVTNDTPITLINNLIVPQIV